MDPWPSGRTHDVLLTFLKKFSLSKKLLFCDQLDGIFDFLTCDQFCRKLFEVVDVAS